ncbi:MAG: crotonase/enoyl-CoA hydratase family protein [Candidatus Tectomicrobia bacterium]|nr:crotonase/enoyl-CoA hydratase family protein [Candidatus Tectomicrobia bacterium]
MSYEWIMYEKLERVARITMNRPEKLNALSVPLQDEIVDAAKDAEADPDIHVVVIRGAGRAFSAGYDITPTPEGLQYRQRRTIREDISRMEETVARWAKIWNLHIPVIAQVHGYCVAGGTDLALHCDMITVADDAQIGFPPVRAMGTPPTHMWIYSVGPQWAKRILLTGDFIDGKTAEKIGFAIQAVPAEELDETTMRLAKRVAHIGTDLLTANKTIVNKALELMGRSMMQQIALETDAISHLSPEAQEFNRISSEQGLRAALEWRDGPFRNP